MSTPEEEKQALTKQEALKAVYEAKTFWEKRELYQKIYGTGTVAMVKGGTEVKDMGEEE